jgi:hypothetical protein
MPTIDEDLNQIERDTRTLKIEYEQFFGGGRQRPPADTQWRVESLLRRYNERTAELSFAQRFRFNNLSQTYAKYQDMWRKRLMQKEGAVSNRHFGAAARAVEAERSRSARRANEASAQETAASSVNDGANSAANDGANSAVNSETAGAEMASAVATTVAPGSAPAGAIPPSPQASAFARSLSDPAREMNKVMELYRKLVETRSETGETTATPSLKDFEKFVRAKTQELQSKGGREVEYSVSVENGRVKLKARVSK